VLFYELPTTARLDKGAVLFYELPTTARLPPGCGALLRAAHDGAPAHDGADKGAVLFYELPTTARLPTAGQARCRERRLRR